MTESDVRFWLEVVFWLLLVGGVLNGERIMRKNDRKFSERQHHEDVSEVDR